MLFLLCFHQMRAVSFMYQFGSVRGFEQKWISLTKLLTLYSHTSDSSSQYALQHVLMIHFWSPLHADSQLISEWCCCLKLCADILWNLQTVQPDHRLSHNSKSVCCPKFVNRYWEKQMWCRFFLKLFPKFIIFLRLTLWLLICHVDFNIRTLQSWVARKEFILFKKHFQSVQVFLVTYINNQLFDLFFSFLVPWTVVKDSLSNNFKICSNTATTVPQRNLISFCDQEMIRKLKSTHLTTSWQMNCNCCPLRYWYTPFA